MKRLNKFITDAGYCSRREADRYIAEGRVTVNGRDAAIGAMVDDSDRVEVDGEKVGGRKKKPVYIICNKPRGVTCTSESSDRTNIVDFIGYKERIFPVGRLDKDSEGLIILTSDGDAVNKILRAGNNNPKEYIVTVDRPVTPSFLKQMGEGVAILGTKTKPCKVFRRNDTTFAIHLTQGLNRQIRRMCQALGYKVVSLRRIRVMNVSLGNLETGRWRHLTTEELREMMSMLASSSGTQEASNEKKARPTKYSHSKPKSHMQQGHKPQSDGPQGSFSQYRQRGKKYDRPGKPAKGAGASAGSKAVSGAGSRAGKSTTTGNTREQTRKG